MNEHDYACLKQLVIDVIEKSEGLVGDQAMDELVDLAVNEGMKMATLNKILVDLADSGFKTKDNRLVIRCPATERIVTDELHNQKERSDATFHTSFLR